MTFVLVVVPDSTKVENQEVKREIDQSCKSNKVNWNVSNKKKQKKSVFLKIWCVTFHFFVIICEI